MDGISVPNIPVARPASTEENGTPLIFPECSHHTPPCLKLFVGTYTSNYMGNSMMSGIVSFSIPKMTELTVAHARYETNAH